MEVNKDIKSDSMKKNFFKLSKFYEFILKVDVKCFGYNNNNLLQEFKFMKTHFNS